MFTDWKKKEEDENEKMIVNHSNDIKAIMSRKVKVTLCRRQISRDYSIIYFAMESAGDTRARPGGYFKELDHLALF